MRNDIIFAHEDWQETPWVSWIGEQLANKGLFALPSLDSVNGIVRPTVNQGRWIVDCPNNCGAAVCISRLVQLFICPNCGSPENPDNWYAVIYPKDRKKIEVELLKRSEKDGWHAKSRNWVRGEKLSDLQAENRGIG